MDFQVSISVQFQKARRNWDKQYHYMFSLSLLKTVITIVSGWLVVWIFSYFPDIGNNNSNWQLTNIFQRDWNHQPAIVNGVYEPTNISCQRWLEKKTTEVALDHKGNVHLYQYTPHSDGREGDRQWPWHVFVAGGLPWIRLIIHGMSDQWFLQIVL